MKPRQIVISSLCVLFASLGLLACSSIESSVCERITDECKLKYKNHSNVDDCTDQLEKDLEAMVDSQREDCEKAYDDCLEKSNCTNFANCVNAMTNCF